ncbi:MAG: hypothetical protein EI684_11235 [Candidatus Viridilinea halotolerans]|uniref:Uncharacterized protein n=1 Tax=Candidatus Viridilinea halotolerans TaxID=2491704 RepID=A0A426TZG7_9CHLR|nr:MAG: hypothetical protein EI684_11235 [Candidatus Viridilinea halotolerans]
MQTSRPEIQDAPGPEGMTFEVTLKVLGISTAYAATLSYLERHFPIKPDHIWAEVAGGVLISLVPVALTARKTQQVDWRLYEGAIWRSFIAAGTPIILWQIGEAMLRQIELLRYTTARELKSAKAYVHDTTPLAERGGDRTRRGDEVC